MVATNVMELARVLVMKATFIMRIYLVWWYDLNIKYVFIKYVEYHPAC